MRSSRLARDQSGGVLVLTAVSLVVLFGFAALVVDVGDWFATKRQAQTAADAGALAAAQDLCNEDADTAIATGEAYVAKNLASATPTVVTPYDGNPGKVEVTVDTTADSYFAAVFGIESADIKTRAVAASACTPIIRPLAVYVHELCGAPTGNKGLIVNGQGARIEGGIHSNGHFVVNGNEFSSGGRATVYRPPPQGTSNPDPTHPQGAGCKTEDQPSSVYCTECAGGSVTNPEDDVYRDWLTPYHTPEIMKGFTPCTINPPGNVKFENTTIPTGVYCLQPGAKFELSNNTSGNITVIGGEIVIGGNSTLRPYNEAHPVIFYNTSSKEIVLNPGGDYNWAGYVINRFGGVVTNAENATSPFKGLIEAEWVLVNGQNFTMLGAFPDPSGGFNSEVTLDE